MRDLHKGESITTAREKTREELLLGGLGDWVHLYQVHYHVQKNHPGFTVEQVKTETLDTIRSLVTDGLFTVGDLSGPNGSFAAWDIPLEESIKRISNAYIDQFDDETAWTWVFWLALTDKGRHAAAAI
ncbi:hypothetical protein [Mycobacterium kyorinense]|uniref:Uncharacterized protein n=1 Tax=Mycobacterium kyorinense TaxID=487514 RepID=A0A1X1Y5L0_9MYCO|nr:hypothetical protein [Mycobacterium kyorinense]ORW06358.1 hypothetical protein AWC14_25760 [Mycobacterium kyorinense]